MTFIQNFIQYKHERYITDGGVVEEKNSSTLLNDDFKAEKNNNIHTTKRLSQY